MKKILLASITILLLAAGCNKQQAPVQPAQNPPAPQQQETKPADETANWKIYSNTKHGYEFKYPTGVTVEAYDAKSSWPATGKDNAIIVGGLFDVISVNAIGGCSDFRTEQAIVSCLGSVSWAKEDHWIPVTIGGLPAVRREVTLKSAPAAGSDIAPVGYTYYVNNGKTGLQISFTDSVARRPLMEQVLSTFKFTETQDETANWKIYNNTTLGYSISYPATWSIDDHTGSSGNRFYLLPPDPLSKQAVDESFSLLIRNSVQENLSLDAARQEMKKPSSVSPDFTETTIVFAGHTAYSYQSSLSNSSASGYAVYILLPVENDFYYIETHGIRPNVISQLKQILSTFKFIK